MPKDPTNHKGGQRNLHIKVKTAKGRKASSTRWLQRQLNDPYVQRAHQEGFRSRAAYKIEEIDDKYKLITPTSTIIDLGAAPGGWLQIAKKRAPKGTIIGLDLLEIEPIDGVTTLQCDFTSDEGYAMLKDAIGDKKADLVISDMAPSSCGHAATDHLRIMAMCEMAFDFAKETLKPGGHFVAKVLQGGAEAQLLGQMKQQFSTVKHMKPHSSRKESSETYVVAMSLK